MPHPRAWRPFILVASYFFYGWVDWRWVLLLVGSTLVNTVAAQVIARSPVAGDPQARADRRDRASTSACSCFFKYFGFFVSRSTTRSTRSGSARRCRCCRSCCRSASRSTPSRRSPTWSTSTAARRRAASLVRLGDPAAFFPHLVAGPIVRANELLPQLRTPRDPRAVLAGPALFLIVGGLVKKMVVADSSRAHRRPGLQRPRRALRAGDRCWRSTASPRRSTATSPATPTWRSAWRCCSASSCRRTSTARTWRSVAPGLLAALAHHAVALAARLPLHPARRQPRRPRRTYRNLMLTMLLGGLWHGAAWTFVIWGGIHGTALSAERWARERFPACACPPGRLADHVQRGLPGVGVLPRARPATAFDMLGQASAGARRRS